ncbi:hypothetical protein [Ekhidna sp.]|uniref:hypothetical protein n=1 Tax=Ekhidna sp. TaxID=2608089 RepID=UPI003C7BE1EC
MKSINWFDHLFNFLAVILGVSLAFYVNSTAEEKRLNTETLQIINSFTEELARDRRVYENYQLVENKMRLERLDKVIDLISKRKTDSLDYLVMRSLPFTNYAPQAVTFKSTSATGKFDLLNDYDLRMNLSKYYTVTAKEAEYRGAGQVEFYQDNIMPWLIQNTDFIQRDASALLDREFLNMLIIYRDLIHNKIRQYEVLAERSAELEAELDTLKSTLQ